MVAMKLIKSESPQTVFPPVIPIDCRPPKLSFRCQNGGKQQYVFLAGKRFSLGAQSMWLCTHCSRVWCKGRALVLGGTQGRSERRSGRAGCQRVSAAEQPAHRAAEGERRGVGLRPGPAWALPGTADSFKGPVDGCSQLLPASSQFFRHFP